MDDPIKALGITDMDLPDGAVITDVVVVVCAVTPDDPAYTYTAVGATPGADYIRKIGMLRTGLRLTEQRTEPVD